MSSKPERPYLDFYGTHNVSPVEQDISNIKKHFERREYLYRRLGVVSSCINGKSVIEFGPGSGHNALFTNSLGPSNYVLVDGNPKGLSDCQKLLAQYFPQDSNYKIVESLIEEYTSEALFDLVLCEGLIPAQKNPDVFLRHIAGFAKPKGVCIITCHDPVSHFSEFLRCLIGSIFTEESMPLKEQVDILLRVFKSHLVHLKGMSRPYEDWVIDNIIHKSMWRDSELFSIEEAITALDSSFDVYGSSPYFITDWRWYKDVFGENKNFNEIALQKYRENLHNFLDYRFIFDAISIEENRKIQKKCLEVWSVISQFGNDKDPKVMPGICEKVQELAVVVRNFSSETADAMDDFVKVLGLYPNLSPDSDWGKFCKWWGRGMQYLSFIRNETNTHP